MKKKLLIIGSIPPPYHGSNVYMKQILESEIHNFFDIYHLDTSDKRNLDNIGKLDLINVYLGLKNLIQLLIILFKNKIDIVYIPIAARILPFLRDSLFILFSALLRKPKIIVHLHRGLDFKYNLVNSKNILIRVFVKYILNKVSTGIVLGKALLENFDNSVNNTVYLHNGINLQEKAKVQKDENIFRIVFLSNFTKQKGILDILDIAINLKEYKDIKFELVGLWRDGEIKTENIFFEKIDYHKLSNITVLGPKYDEEKNRFLATGDVFLFPSYMEGFPLVLLEAMNQSLPIISTKGVGAISEVIIHDDTGFLFNPGDINKCRNYILKYYHDRKLAKTHGSNGYNRLMENFTINKNINGLIKVLDS